MKGAWARPITAAVLTESSLARSSGLVRSRTPGVSLPRRGTPSSKRSAWRLQPPGALIVSWPRRSLRATSSDDQRRGRGDSRQHQLHEVHESVLHRRLREQPTQPSEHRDLHEQPDDSGRADRPDLRLLHLYDADDHNDAYERLDVHGHRASAQRLRPGGDRLRDVHRRHDAACVWDTSTRIGPQSVSATGTIGSNKAAYVDANVTDAISGVNTVTATLPSSLSTTTSVTLTLGSYTAGANTDDYRGSFTRRRPSRIYRHSFSATATDNATNSNHQLHRQRDWGYRRPGGSDSGLAYQRRWTGSTYINVANEGSINYSVTDASGSTTDTITVTLTSTGGGGSVSGSAVRTSSPTAVNGINASSLGDGTVTATAMATQHCRQ